jgi:large subunit ribosomal protein L21
MTEQTTSPSARSAVFRSGSKQYRVQEGDVIDVELLESAEKGKQIEFKEVLYTVNGNDIKVGAPLISKASVAGIVLETIRGPKVIAYKYKKRKNYRRKVGHRQNYNRVKITGITG